MKKTLFFLVTILSVCTISKSFAQEAPRYKMEMTIEANGKSSKVEVSSVNYSITRNTYDISAEPKKEKEKSKEMYSIPAPQEFYLSVTLNKIDKNLLSIIANKKTTSNGVIVITDTYGKDETRKLEFRNAMLTGLSESLSSYNTSYGGAGSLSVSAKELIIDGIAIQL